MNYGKRAVEKQTKSLDAKGNKVGSKIGLWIGRLVLIALFLVCVIGISSGIGVWKGIIDSAPDISSIDVTPTGYSTTVLAEDGTEITTLVAAGANRKYVTLDETPENLQHAFVAIEDSRFYDHNGIDITGIIRAFFVGVKSGGHFSEGASTITQQLIKNNVLTTWTSESSFIEKLQRKVQEQYLAVELEKQVSKDWILENYMNSINLGANTLGVQAASERYFGKDVSELTLSECAVIAGITQNPSAYNPISHPDKNAERREKVLNNMKDQGYITQAEYDEAMADNVYDRIAEYNAVEEASVNSYFVDALIEDVYNDLIDELGYSETEAYKALYQGGLTIQSTQDLDMQAICDEEANNIDNYEMDTKYSFSMSFQVKYDDGTYKTYSHQTMLSYYKAMTGNENYTINYDTEEDAAAAIEQYKQDVLADGGSIVEGTETVYYTLEPQVAFTVIDNETGEVKAIVGGRGEKEGNRTWNRATDTTRQPGSTFKIIAAYSAALDAGGCTLATVQDNADYTVGTKTYKGDTGYTTLRQGIIHSLNVVAVKTLEQVGVNLGYDYAVNYGFTTLTEGDKNLGLCLGGLTYGVTNLELTGAYATIANQGVYQEPKFYTAVYDHDGNLLLDKAETQETHEVISEQTAWLLTSAMQDVLTQGTGTKAYFGSSMAQAGKTGTTTNNRDNLFAGFTPYYTCVVWGGYDDNSIQAKNSAYQKIIWKNVMSRIHEGLEYKGFDMPEGITTAAVCAQSGLLPEAELCDCDQRGSQIITEYFKVGTVPTETCNVHIALDICAESGMIANQYCPAEQVERRIFVTGAQPGSDEDLYNATDEFLQQTCTLHNETTNPPDPGAGDGTGDGTGDGSGNGSDGGGLDTGTGDGSGTENGSGGTTGTTGFLDWLLPEGTVKVGNN